MRHIDDTVSPFADELFCDDLFIEEPAAPGDDFAGFPRDMESWVCTCGQENEGTDRCVACDQFLHERDAYWDSI